MSPQTSISDYLVKLKRRFLVAEQTMALQFEKPAGFTFHPGQWIDITLLNPSETDEKGNTRGFSIASAPHEDFLMVVTRLRDTAYKRQLPHLPLNTEVKLEGPGGNLRLHNKTAHAVDRRDKPHFLKWAFAISDNCSLCRLPISQFPI